MGRCITIAVEISLNLLTNVIREDVIRLRTIEEDRSLEIIVRSDIGKTRMTSYSSINQSLCIEFDCELATITESGTRLQQIVFST